MRIRIFSLRSDVIPPWQKMVAAALVIAVGTGIFVISLRSAKQSAATAVLSFDPDIEGRNDPAFAHAVQPAVAVAQSMLSESVVLKLLSKAGASPSDPAFSIGEFRSRLELDEPAIRTLRVLYHDPDARRSRAVANAVAVAIAGWTPSFSAPIASAPLDFGPAAVPPSPPLAAPAGHRRRHLSNLAEQLDVTDQKIGELTNEGTSPVLPAAAALVPSAQTEQRRTLEVQLAAAQQKLEALRVRYTNQYPDVKTTEDTIAEIQNELAALPAPAKPSTPKSPVPAAHAAEIKRLRQERAQLTKEIAIEWNQLARVRDHSDNGEAASPSSSAPRPASASRAPAPVEQQISPFSSAAFWQNPFQIVRLTRISTASFAWTVVVTGILGALFFSGAALIVFYPRGGMADIHAVPLATAASAPPPAWAQHAEETTFDEPLPIEQVQAITEPRIHRIDRGSWEERVLEADPETRADRDEEPFVADFVEMPAPATEALPGRPQAVVPEANTAAELYHESFATGLVEIPAPARAAFTTEPEAISQPEVEASEVAEPHPDLGPLSEDSKPHVEQPAWTCNSFAHPSLADAEWTVRLLKALSRTSLGELYGEADQHGLKSKAAHSTASASVSDLAELPKQIQETSTSRRTR